VINKSNFLNLGKTLFAGFRKDASFFSRAVVVALLIAVLALVASTSYIYTNQEFLIFKFPPKDFSADLKINSLETELFKFKSGENEVFGWHFIRPNTTNTLIYFYGVGDNAAKSIKKLNWMSSFLNCSIICCDYPGYGKSTGKTSEKHMDLFIKDFGKYLSTSKKNGNQNIFLWGYSLGGALALKYNQKNQVEFTLLESTFSSISKIAQEQFPLVLPFIPFNVINRNPFDNVEAIKKIKNPILIIHSGKDSKINIQHAIKLKAASDRVVELFRTHHEHSIQFPAELPEYKKVIHKYLSHWFL